jgi:ParB family transcriptional regulator, chromosome partitioning protein
MATDTESKPIIYKKGKIYPVALDSLKPDENQPRKNVDDASLQELMKSIEDHDLLCPIIFRVDEAKGLILVSGERRYSAFLSLGRATIPGMFIDDPKYDEVALVDNVQRVDLNPIDFAESVKGLKEKYEYTLLQIGSIIGKAETTVSEILKLAELPQEIRDDARTKNLSRNALLKVARKETAKGQKTAYKILIAALSKDGTKRPYVKQDNYQKVSTITANAIKGIQSIDLDKLGDNKADMEDKLRQLLTAIQDKLSMIAS